VSQIAARFRNTNLTSGDARHAGGAVDRELSFREHLHGRGDFFPSAALLMRIGWRRQALIPRLATTR